MHVYVLSIYPLVYTWVASTFCLLWMMLLWTLVYEYLFRFLLLLIFLCIYLTVKLLSHMIILFDFLKTGFFGDVTIMFLIVATPFSHQPYTRAPVSPHSHQYFSFLFFFFYNNYPDGCKVVHSCSSICFPNDVILSTF